MIPLTLAGCISFTSTPIFSFFLAFVLLREKLNMQETFAVFSGILGTMLLIMPQWFLWLGINVEGIQARVEADYDQYGETIFYIGLFCAFFSAFLDSFSYFMMRSIGKSVPSVMLPFCQGVFTSVIIFIWSLIFEPFDFVAAAANPTYGAALAWGMASSIVSYLA